MGGPRPSDEPIQPKTDSERALALLRRVESPFWMGLRKYMKEMHGFEPKLLPKWMYDLTETAEHVECPDTLRWTGDKKHQRFFQVFQLIKGESPRHLLETQQISQHSGSTWYISTTS